MRAWEFNRFGRGASGILVPKLVGRRERPFSIIQVFADGTEGFWLNSNVDQNHYVEDTGETESGDGNTLGLAISQAQGGFGNPEAEQVTNPEFVDGETGWSLTGTNPPTISGEQVHFSEAESGDRCSQTVNTGNADQDFFRFLVDVDSISAGRLNAAISTIAGINLFDMSAGQNRTILLSQDDTGALRLQGDNSSPGTGSINSASWRKIPGWHFRQTASASRLTREKDSKGNWFYRLDGSDDFTEAPAAHFEPPFVLAGVFAVDGTDAAQTLMGGFDSSATDQAGELFYDHANGEIGVYNGASLSVVSGQQPVSPVVVVAVIRGANSELHVGDTVVTGNSGSNEIDLGTFELGRRSNDNDQHFNGRVWQPFGINRDMTSSEIENLKSELGRLSTANP